MKKTPWYILRAKEGRGFVSKRILYKILAYQSILFGQAYLSHDEKFCRVINIEEMRKNIKPFSVRYKNLYCPDCKKITTMSYDLFEDMYRCCKCEYFWYPVELGIRDNPEAGYLKLNKKE